MVCILHTTCSVLTMNLLGMVGSKERQLIPQLLIILMFQDLANSLKSQPYRMEFLLLSVRNVFYPPSHATKHGLSARRDMVDNKVDNMVDMVDNNVDNMVDMVNDMVIDMVDMVDDMVDE